MSKDPRKAASPDSPIEFFASFGVFRGSLVKAKIGAPPLGVGGSSFL
jgi:hypothetical protein